MDARGVKVCALHPSEFADAHPPPLEGEAKKPFGSARRAVDSIASPTREGALYHSPRCLPYEGCARRRVSERNRRNAAALGAETCASRRAVRVGNCILSPNCLQFGDSVSTLSTRKSGRARRGAAAFLLISPR